MWGGERRGYKSDRASPDFSTPPTHFSKSPHISTHFPTPSTLTPYTLPNLPTPLLTPPPTLLHNPDISLHTSLHPHSNTLPHSIHIHLTHNPHTYFIMYLTVYQIFSHLLPNWSSNQVHQKLFVTFIKKFENKTKKCNIPFKLFKKLSIFVNISNNAFLLSGSSVKILCTLWLYFRNNRDLVLRKMETVLISLAYYRSTSAQRR